MKLIDNVGIVWHRLWAVRLSIVSAAYSASAGAWVLLPYAWQPTLSEPMKWALAAIGVALAAAPGVSRVIAQPKLAEKVTEKTGTASITVPVPLAVGDVVSSEQT